MTDTARPRRPKLSKEGVTTLLDVSGVVLVCGGVAAIYWPAALILAGLAALAASWKASR
ncbi:MAG: hypothetical protein RJQ01_08070 [Microcella sp.]|uniref:Uncharacterized protein n=1 Tax=Microcella pacifica TaxID=2591847 RepID=A0A9E5JP03_9MICO|nr:hypothetical protein [Microcella pacifica]NHF62242.1 hypothetical protein [Microcella pacifica]